MSVFTDAQNGVVMLINPQRTPINRIFAETGKYPQPQCAEVGIGGTFLLSNGFMFRFPITSLELLPKNALSDNGIFIINSVNNYNVKNN